jgi:hypothetical protein
MGQFRGYVDNIALQSADELITHKTDDGRVVVLEYEVHGTILATGAKYTNRFCSIIKTENRKIAHWRELHGLSRGLECIDDAESELMQAPALNAPATLFPNDLVRSDAVLRASPLGPVSSLNRTFGSAATGTPGARRRPDADPRAAAGPHLASAANTGNRDEERNHDALRRFRHNPNRASGRLNPAFVMIEGARQGRLLCRRIGQLFTHP